ncbi:threonylcarbamoyl-AMP synthase [Alloscardovia theropitheci]|uniref:L-threonylcarbamoyladenylate synthase n=1 Tax=Alloscardovia theropitheci TaxID=2496842 RepID=A0A4R0QSD6_9BIFI|nr:L-threonylcarbamoyladenylate synthase [Alloscardovia theropitheci]TCD54035.1 threonylcarbamoyl-AMP synthase [Alloscardovia theropitheci]
MTKKYGIQPVNDETIALAVSLIQAGEVVVIPTDTVYGVVADPTNAQAVEKIFSVKHRPHEKTMQILAARMEDTKKFGVQVPAKLVPVEKEFMPGAVSIIVDIKTAPAESFQDAQQEYGTSRSPVLATVRQEKDGRVTQGIRLPSSDIALKILEQTGPLAASSANLSGMDSPATVQDAYKQLGDSVSLYLDGGSTPGPVASTVVAWDNETEQLLILREGVVSSDRIRAVLA